MEPQYIGDGVYVSTDGFGLNLHLGDHRSPSAVYLEPEVMEALIKYHQKLQSLRKRE